MEEVRLSPSQRAYLFNPERFLRGLNERAEALYRAGYRVRPDDLPGMFQITLRQDTEEKLYRVDALKRTCTCAFFTRQRQGERLLAEGILECKHLRGLRGLVRKTRLAHFKAEEFQAGYRLWTHWLATLSREAECREQALQRRFHAQQQQDNRQQHKEKNDATDGSAGTPSTG